MAHAVALGLAAERLLKDGRDLDPGLLLLLRRHLLEERAHLPGEGVELLQLASLGDLHDFFLGEGDGGADAWVAAQLPQRVREDLRHGANSDAAPAARARPRLVTDGLEALGALLDCPLDDPLLHGVAVAHVVRGGQVRAIAAIVNLGRGAGHDVLGREAAQVRLLRDGRELGEVNRGRTDENAAQELFAIGGEDQLLVVARLPVLLNKALDLALVRAPVDAAEPEVRGAAEGGDVHAHELELRGQVAARVLLRRARVRQVAHQHLRLGEARRDQAVAHAAGAGALAHGPDVLVGRGPHLLVHLDAAARAQLEAAGLGELLARAHAGRHDDHGHLELGDGAVLLDLEPANCAAGILEDLQGLAAGVHLHAQALNLLLDDGAGLGVDLHAEEHGGELDDVDLEAQVVHGLRRLEAEEAAADDRGLLGSLGVVDDGLAVVDRAVHEDALGVREAGRRRWDEGLAARGQHQVVVRHDLAAALAQVHVHLLRAAIDAGRLAEHQLDAALDAPLGGAVGDLVVRAVLEVRGELDAVVGSVGLLTDHSDLDVACGNLQQPLDDAMADGAVADKHNGLGRDGRAGRELVAAQEPVDERFQLDPGRGICGVGDLLRHRTL
mmetsp:Transcript_94355/g.243673  ORF Transcript_94355/g.243673 Transcript_94355/m.243673 type:complete len:612 (+) Transcript_94355:547-2382(+)